VLKCVRVHVCAMSKRSGSPAAAAAATAAAAAAAGAAAAPSSTIVAASSSSSGSRSCSPRSAATRRALHAGSRSNARSVYGGRHSAKGIVVNVGGGGGRR